MKNTAICIGRQYGSGGREVGQRLAEYLGVSCYDKLLIQQTARESGMSSEYVAKQEERPERGMWMLSGNPFADSAELANAFYSGSERVYQAERNVILELAAKGPCVIVGRCASAILRQSGCMAVFLYADEQDRLHRVMQRNALDAHTAAIRLRHVDRLRREYFELYAQTKWEQPEGYDLMLSTSCYGVDGCAKLILAAYQQESEGTKQ